MLSAHVALVSESASVDLGALSPVSAALQKQVARDFGPLWQVTATVDSFQALDHVPTDYWPIILRDDIQQAGAAGYHTDNNGQPYSLVQVSDGWELTVSHEALEMLADPFGNRTIAGAPPPQATGPAADLTSVLYLVEVCDPCEDGQFSYTVNGVQVSDFITPNYYDPITSPSVRYSFQGTIESPHQVLAGGYVSFGNPIDNNWYQVLVDANGNPQMKSLGQISVKSGKSLRESVDELVRKTRPGYRTAAMAMAKSMPVVNSGLAQCRKGRADSLRKSIEALR